jgi:hypothetical protein
VCRGQRKNRRYQSRLREVRHRDEGGGDNRSGRRRARIDRIRVSQVRTRDKRALASASTKWTRCLVLRERAACASAKEWQWLSSPPPRHLTEIGLTGSFCHPLIIWRTHIGVLRSEWQMGTNENLEPSSAWRVVISSARRVLTGRNRDDGRRRFCRFLAATTTHRYAWRLTCSRRVPFPQWLLACAR